LHRATTDSAGRIYRGGLSDGRQLQYLPTVLAQNDQPDGQRFAPIPPCYLLRRLGHAIHHQPRWDSVSIPRDASANSPGLVQPIADFGSDPGIFGRRENLSFCSGTLLCRRAVADCCRRHVSVPKHRRGLGERGALQNVLGDSRHREDGDGNRLKEIEAMELRRGDPRNRQQLIGHDSKAPGSCSICGRDRRNHPRDDRRRRQARSIFQTRPGREKPIQVGVFLPISKRSLQD